jgi:outer membrane protein
LNAEKEFQTLQEELSKSLYEAIEKASVEYGKSNNLALVVVKRELLYLANGVDAQDVSAGIIKLMDEKWAKK